MGVIRQPAGEQEPEGLTAGEIIKTNNQKYIQMNNKYNPQKEKHLKKVKALYKVGTPISRIETLTGITRKTIRIWLTAAGLYKPSYNNNINRYHNNKGQAIKETPEAPQTQAQAILKDLIAKPQPSTPEETPRLTDPIYKDLIDPIDKKEIDINTIDTEAGIIDNHKADAKLFDKTNTDHINNLDQIIARILKRLKNSTVLADMSGIQLAKSLDVVVNKRVQLQQGNNTGPEASTIILQFINNRDFKGEITEIEGVKQKAITVQATE